MGFADEVRGYLADRVMALLQEAIQRNTDRVQEVLQDLKESFQNLEAMLSKLEEVSVHPIFPETDSPVATWAEQIAQMTPPSPLASLASAMDEMDRATTQKALLQALFQAASVFTDAIALFVVRGEHITGWQGIGCEGVGADPATFRSFTVPLEDAASSWIQGIREQVPQFRTSPFDVGDAAVVEKVVGRVPQVFVLLPIVVQGKTVGLFYADRRDRGWREEERWALEILVRYASKALETMPARLARLRARGLAAEAAPSEEERLHEEAQRFARLLVQEIKMYNEQEVLIGRQNRDLYHRLKDDIERSRRVYLERYPSSLISDRDYFYEELVRVLADGDPSLLGIEHWPTES